jgi:hypothetical protein
MTVEQWVTLVIAILGVLHGPLVANLLTKRNNTQSKP